MRGYQANNHRREGTATLQRKVQTDQPHGEKKREKGDKESTEMGRIVCRPFNGERNDQYVGIDCIDGKNRRERETKCAMTMKNGRKDGENSDSF